ncbi:hypothetical protein DH2020_013923 [Rehmannia glutinosa]|uniref:Major facilitator superfamily (MFS) profile domain-containing protein n=1 Tax=Rehmannia glutinosa TaxID=99300 RepID=A0ABR0WUW3_REHGL
MSGATIYIKKDFKITDVQIEILVGTINIYSLLGSAMAGRTSDWLGRRITIVFASAIFFIGALVMGFANNYAVLMVGRFIAGLGVGYALMIAPVYAAEVAPTSSRGFLTCSTWILIKLCICQVSLKIGLAPNAWSWRSPICLPCPCGFHHAGVPSLASHAGPPRRCEGARQNVRLTEEAHHVSATSKRRRDLGRLQRRVVEVPKTDRPGGGVWRDLLVHPTRPVLHIVIAALGLQFLQQASGIDAVVMYSPRIYEKAGITSDSKKLLATIAVGVCKTLFILVTTFFVDKIGRRVLLLTSCGGLDLSLFTLATGLTVIDQYGADKFKWLVGICIGATYTSVAFFSMGMGPIAWVYSSEVFPLKLRAQGCGMGVAINRLTSGVILMSFISLYKAITIGGAFYLFTGIAVITWIFFFTLLPETRGRTLEDMEVLFGSFFKWRTTMRELRKKESSNPIDAA